MFLSHAKATLQLSAVRYTIGLLTLFSLITFVAWGGTYWLVQREMLQAVDARLTERMQDAVAALTQGAELPAPTDGQTSELASGEFLDGFQTRIDDEEGKTEFRYFVSTTKFGQIRLGENTERQDELRDILAGGMQLAFLAMLLATCLTGLWLARRSQARLDIINEGLAKIAKGQLDTRISLTGPNDDLTLLANRIDTTAERLEYAMAQMRIQSSNIAHDLRTPLARLRAQIETHLIALSKDNETVSVDDLGEALEQIDQITATFDALLRLARIESGAGREKFEPVDLVDLARRVQETFVPVVESSGRLLDVQNADAAHVQGDPEMLLQLLANLIQNAIRHGIGGKVITLRVCDTRILVIDEGPGIPLHERETALQPLYQLETTRQAEGFGLGLSLVRAIADLHDAKLSLSDGPGGRGLEVLIEFPKLTEL